MWGREILGSEDDALDLEYDCFVLGYDVEAQEYVVWSLEYDRIVLEYNEICCWDKKLHHSGVVLCRSELALLFLDFVAAEIFLGLGEDNVLSEDWIILS